MMDYKHYRKFLEPSYGEAAPDAVIDEGQEFDLEHPTECRIRMNFETITGLTLLWKNTYCFKHIMQVKTVNTVIHKQDHDIPVRVYCPEGEGPFPVMVFYHGGGWTMNSVDVYDYVPRYFAKYGKVLVVTPEYRLAPENLFPKGVEDCYDTLVWASENAAEFGGAPEQSLTVCGDSAGGNLAIVMTLLSRDRQGPVIHKQFPIFPATVFKIGYRTASELRYGDGGYFLTMNSENGMIDYYFEKPEDAESPYASPLLAKDLTSLPPACFISAECDPLLDQALMYAARLQDAGVDVEYHIYKGMVHAFINRPQQKTFEAFDDIIAAIPKVR